MLREQEGNLFQDCKANGGPGGPHHIEGGYQGGRVQWLS